MSKKQCQGKCVHSGNPCTRILSLDSSILPYLNSNVFPSNPWFCHQHQNQVPFQDLGLNLAHSAGNSRSHFLLRLVDSETATTYSSGSESVDCLSSYLTDNETDGEYQNNSLKQSVERNSTRLDLEENLIDGFTFSSDCFGKRKFGNWDIRNYLPAAKESNSSPKRKKRDLSFEGNALDWIDPSTSFGTRKKLLLEMNRPLSPKDEAGWIYVYQMLKSQSTATTPTATDLYKIGRSKNVYRRLTQWSHQCGYTPLLIDYFPAPPKTLDTRRKNYTQSISTSISLDTTTPIPETIKSCKYSHRAERLIHLELQDRFCAGVINCNGNCGGNHKEWFKIPSQSSGVSGWKFLKRIIKKWVKFVSVTYDKQPMDLDNTSAIHVPAANNEDEEMEVIDLISEDDDENDEVMSIISTDLLDKEDYEWKQNSNSLDQIIYDDEDITFEKTDEELMEHELEPVFTEIAMKTQNEERFGGYQRRQRVIVRRSTNPVVQSAIVSNQAFKVERGEWKSIVPGIEIGAMKRHRAELEAEENPSGQSKQPSTRSFSSTSKLFSPEKSKTYETLVTDLSSIISKNSTSPVSVTDKNPSKIPSLSGASRKLDPESFELQKTIKSLKKQLADTKSTLTKKVISLEQQNGKLELNLSETKSKNEKMQKELSYMLDRNKKDSSDIQNLQNEKTQLQKQCDTFKTTISKLKESEQSYKQTFEREQSSHKQKTVKLENQIQILESHLQDMKKKLQTQLETAAANQTTLAKAQNEIIELTKKLRAQDSDALNKENYDTLKSELSEQLKYIKNLETKHQSLLAKYKYYHSLSESISRLKEENTTLQHQVSTIPYLRDTVAKLTVENESLVNERNRWAKFLDEQKDDLGGIGVDSVYSLSKLLAKQRLELALYKEREGEEEGKRKVMEVYIRQLEEELNQLKSELEKKSQEFDTLNRNYKGLNSLLIQGKKEVTLLRDQLNTYELEFQMTDPDSFNQLQSTRIQQLQSTIDEWKQKCESMQGEISQLRSSARDSVDSSAVFSAVESIYSPQVSGKISGLEKLNSDLKMENQLLKQQVGVLDEQIGVYERRLGRGEYDASRIKVLQLIDNPESQEYAIRTESLDLLRKENKSLRNRLETLEISLNKTSMRAGEKGLENVSGMLPIESFKVLELECAGLKKELAAKDKRLVRLKEVYATKASEYREAVFSVLGFRLDFDQNARVRIKSMYSSPVDPTFLFASGPDDSGSMEMIGGTEERRSLIQENLIDLYVKQKGSVPACMAAFTLGLFQEEK
ncbi:coiled-coil domain-containing protein mad1 [Nowakowskiella sp. JEL0407]|nr:coiled-coil domain-containing protein mad1 [Nowakowskiella sp. JEL0407]